MTLVENISQWCELLLERRARHRKYLKLSATVETIAGQKNTDAFFTELRKITRQTGSITHAFAEPDGNLVGYVQLYRAGGTITIHRIWTIIPKQGHGSKMLRKICALADRYHVYIKLKIAPLGPRPHPMSAPLLREWYHRHGFRGDSRLIRSPVSN